MVFQKELRRRTNGHGDMLDLTADASKLIGQSGVKVGLAHVFVVGSTAAVSTIEFEPGLRKDLPALLDALIPPSAGQGHEQTWHDGNGHSHLQATLLGPSLTLPVCDGKPVLGTWQQIVLIECDIIARDRTIMVTVTGEGFTS
jgi:secondary thiamine-phosphate synthase enzyme